VSSLPKLSIYSRLIRRPAGWLLAPSLSVLILFFILPTTIFFIYSFLISRYYRVTWIFTLENYYRAFTTPVYLASMLNSLTIGILTAITTILISYPFAYFLTFRMKRGRNLVLFLVVISLLGSYLIRVYAWKTILGREGVINTLLITLGLIKEPLLFLLFSRFAVIITLTHVFLPFTVLPIMSSMQNISVDLIESARDLGCNPFQAFLRVTLPLSSTGVLSGFAYTFILTSADYITPQLVGGTSGGMIGLSITNQFIKVGNLALGSALSFLLLLLLVSFVAAVRIVARKVGMRPNP
jgi:spermidine/putrescine transport system permease protein